jgi:HD-GYP domain-containing protein (c-di-GMP phosphodiesterase class II)
VASLRVKIEELQEGCILTDDVFCLTNRPIIRKKTVLTRSLIDILNAFLIEDVKVEKTLINGLPFIPTEIIEEESGNMVDEVHVLGVTDLFLQAVRDYKKEFTSWQSGMQVDLSKIRNILLPLLEKMENLPSELFNLYHLSTREDYLYQHSIAVGLISGYIGKKMNYSKGDWVQIALAGCLADCGMAKVNPTIINKSSSLTFSEYEEIKKHPVFSYKLVQNITVLRKEMKIAILQHHERLDGSGYPLGEKEHKIHAIAKIIAAADIFHAMTSERFYRNKQSPYKVLEMINQDNFGKFDLNVIHALSRGIVNFTIGDKIRLSDGRLAEIQFIDDKSPTRPLVKILETDEMIPLNRNRHLFIDETL